MNECVAEAMVVLDEMAKDEVGFWLQSKPGEKGKVLLVYSRNFQGYQ